MQPIRRIDPVLIQQYQTASVLASLMVRANVIDIERSEMAAIEATNERRKDVLSLAGLFVAFAVLTWPLILRGAV